MTNCVENARDSVLSMKKVIEKAQEDLQSVQEKFEKFRSKIFE